MEIFGVERHGGGGNGAADDDDDCADDAHHQPHTHTGTHGDAEAPPLLGGGDHDPHAHPRGGGDDEFDDDGRESAAPSTTPRHRVVRRVCCLSPTPHRPSVQWGCHGHSRWAAGIKRTVLVPLEPPHGIVTLTRCDRLLSTTSSSSR